MNNENNKKSIREKVLEAIKSGRITMRPKWHFVFKTALMVTGGVLLFLTILYLISFTVFALRRSGAWFVPAFGSRGWFAFLTSLPWILILISFIFVIILEVLVKRYAFAYRRPLLYSAVAIIILAMAGGFMVAKTPIHGRLLTFTEKHQLPLARDFYRGFGSPRLPDIHRGEIIATTTGGVTIQNLEGETLGVAITPKTRLPFGMNFEKGDSVVVFGPRDNDVIQAFGIREIDKERMEIPFRGPRPDGPRPNFPLPAF